MMDIGLILQAILSYTAMYICVQVICEVNMFSFILLYNKGAEFLCHIIGIYFENPTKLFSKVVLPVCILTSILCVQISHILTNT